MDQSFLRRVKRRDRIARTVITVGGMVIIFSVILILMLIGNVTLPLFQEPSAEIYSRFSLPQPELDAGVLEVGVDEYLERVFVLDASGDLNFYGVPDGELLKRIVIEPPEEGATLAAARRRGTYDLQLLWSDGTLSLERVGFTARFDEAGQRSFEMGVERRALFAPSDHELPALESMGRIGAEGRRTRVDLLPGSRLAVTQVEVTEDFMGNVEEESFSFTLDEAGREEVTALALDGEGATLYAGTSEGMLLRWDLSEADEPQLLDRLQAFEDRRAVTSLALVLGDISLAVGDAQGKVTTWFPVPVEGSSQKQLRLIHTLPHHYAPVTSLVPSQRDKSVLSLCDDGYASLDHMTSERHLVGFSDLSPLRRMGFSARGNAMVALTEEGRVILWSVDNPHPEVSLKTLFGKVWYESYNEPDYVWQSSSASDDFEPKLSLTPLIYGTLKGTFYAMILAVPLALLGAVYTSQFGNPKMRQWIKPTVEIMAAIPSVVIGFLAALWFAPLLERNLGGLFLSLAFVPAAFVLALLLWQWLRGCAPLRRIERGYEFAAIAPVLVLAVAAAGVLGPLFEDLLFGGDFKMWLFTEGGARFDQRNSIVIAFALGFAVIPIIFTIAEDALSNVPVSLKAASLALGASRWQTVWRVILPSASPGIFAGIMIGLGRAIGETMIVLMATGNTPIMDLSIFNGMRPLSSNIAVEIPEAPHGGTLYRVLFFSAVLLFILTFVLNTCAEVVRQRLRKKYGQFQ